MTAPYNLRMFDIFGAPLDRFHATFNCVWAKNEYGTAEWEMSCTDPKATRRNFEFGRYVLFEHARLGRWAGVIAPHDGMSGTWENTVTLRARSGEFQFSRRQVPTRDINNVGNHGMVMSGTYGEMLKQIIRYANDAPGDSLLRLGVIEMGGKERILPMRDSNMRDLLDMIVEETGWEWWCEPILENGYLRFAVNLAVRRGVESGYTLRERVNLRRKSGDLWRRKGDLVNDVRVAGGSGSTPLRFYGTQTDVVSVGEYGVWQGYDTVELESETKAQARADEIIAQQSDPPYELFLEAIENRQSPDTFAHIGIGDTVTVRIDSARFYGSQTGINEPCRILTREYNTKMKSCILTVEVL